MKMYKITLYVMNFNNDFKDVEEVIETISNNRYIFILKGKGEEMDIGEWSDEHLLNYKDTKIEEFEKYFENKIEIEPELMKRIMNKKTEPINKERLTEYD